MSAFAELQKLVQEHKAEMIDLKFSGLFGQWQHVTYPTSALNERLMTRGVPFDGSSVPGFRRAIGADLMLIPDPSSARVDPFEHVPTITMICQVSEAGTGEWFDLDPRVIARRAIDHMRAQGPATGSLWQVELEFYIFNSVAFSSEVNTSFYRIDSNEAHWNTGSGKDGQLGCNIPHRGGYCAIPPHDRLHNIRSAMTRAIQAAGIPVKCHHHEVGGPGQCEIELARLPLLEAADGAMFAKYIIKNLAIHEGLSPTFMPKPLYDEAGSGLHFHQNLMQGDQNLFYDAQGPDGLSEFALHYIGGLLKHGRALLGLTNPSTNSYKRLVPGFEAPTLLFYGPANRSAAIRIPKYANEPAAQRAEFRPPDGTCNVYLAMAAQLLAGLDGIKQRIDPRKLGWGPIRKTITDLDPEQRENIECVPTSLPEALQALADDHAFLTEPGAFPEEFISTWIDYKMNRDVIEVRNRPHPYEMILYYDA